MTDKPNDTGALGLPPAALNFENVPLDQHDTHAPITLALLMQHLTGVRAVVENIRDRVDAFERSVAAEREAAHQLLANARAFKLAAQDLTNELLDLRSWRERTDERLDQTEERRNGNGAHAG